MSSIVIVTSPDGDLHFRLRLTSAGALQYCLYRGTDPDANVAVRESALAIQFEQSSFVDELEVVDVSPIVERTWSFSMPHGKRRQSAAPAHECRVEVANADGLQLCIEIVVFDDGAAHRFVTSPGDEFTLVSDGSTFVFDPEGHQYAQPHDPIALVAPASESLYSGAVPIGTGFPVLPGWCFPLLLRAGGQWTLLTESGVDSRNRGSRLETGVLPGEYRIVPPLEDEGEGPDTFSSVVGPWELPWRVIITSLDLGDIVRSDLAALVAPPPDPSEDWSWVRPGRVSWSWWSDSDSPTNPEALRKFIDLAAAMTWEFSLIDANWNTMPDGTIEDLLAYGAERNVGLFLWYNSGGPHNTVPEKPRDRMIDRAVRRREMAWMRDLGVVGIKVDFFQSDKQSMNALSWDILRDAADHQLMVNLHGITAPKAWSRTWPNLMTQEGVRGAENYKFHEHFPASAPRHNTVLPFTRNVVAPLDYTPMTLSDVDHPHLTTSAHELALGVLFESALQHPADKPEAYQDLPAPVQDYLRRLPVVWDEVVLLDGEPGKHVVLARRHEDEWWIAGINGRYRDVTVSLDLSVLSGLTAPLTVVGDGAEPRVLSAQTWSTGPLDITMSPYGGLFAWPQ